MQIRQRETTDEEHEINVNMNINSNYMAPWSFETNWDIAHGSLESSINVESSDYQITDSDQQDPIQISPLVLNLPSPDSGPCEIKICFRQKYDIGQVYVRSTARVYEIYYANSPESSNEYLCTVRCGVAERDEMFLQTTGIEDVPEEHEEGFIGELTEEIITEGANNVTSEDDWIKVKAPEDGRSSSSNKTNINTGKNDFSSIKTTNINKRKKVQDVYEATAQISDADPCTVLTVRLLSLQGKGCVYIDEVYVYADPVESTDAGNQAMQPGSSNGSSLMAMLVPTLLQLSKSGISQVQDRHASGEVQKDDKMETGLPTIDATEITTGKNHMKELTGDQQYVKFQKGDESASVPAKVQPSSSTLNIETRVEPVDMHDLPQGRLERALEQLISRVSRVEDICLRFEERILKPIERMEARLQQVEHQLETLAKNSQYSGMPHCGRISAPPFSCSQSNSSSFYNEGSNNQPCEESELEKKDLSFSNMSNLSHNAPNSLNTPYSHPSLVVSAPEFLCDEDEEDNDDLEPLKDSTCIKSKQTSIKDEEDNDDLEPLKDSTCIKSKQTSINAALAAALSGFLSAATVHSSEHVETISGSTSGVGEKNQHSQHAVSLQMKAQHSFTVENGSEESSHYTQIFTVTAPDFTAKEIGDEEHSNNTQSPSDLAFEFSNEENGCCSKIIPPTVQSKTPVATENSWYFNGNESLHDLGSTSSAACAGKSRNLDNGHLHEIPEPSTQDGSLKEDTRCGSVGNSIDSPLDQAEDLATDNCQNIGETRPREPSSVLLDDKDITSEQDSGHEFGNTSDTLLENAECTKYVAVDGCSKDNLSGVSESSCASLVDFDIPILEVKFNFNDYTSIKPPLEVLLDGAAESNVEAPFIQETGDGVVNAEENYIVDDNEPTAIETSDHLLVDLGISSMDVLSNVEDGLHNLCGPSNPEMFVSLI
ncbi:Uncharacterized protein Adt_44663 [Abeliophyllum distichum]|uniref:Uncharacterized protein n=1 Tax=Abeliophyllum distichum TaxID=126358 RepID=A0ABD1PCV2_9LAMI